MEEKIPTETKLKNKPRHTTTGGCSVGHLLAVAKGEGGIPEAAKGGPRNTSTNVRGGGLKQEELIPCTSGSSGKTKL